MPITSLYPVIATDHVARLADFYRAHFGLQTAFEADWYVHLTDGAGANLAILQTGHETIPEGFRTAAAPRLLNFEMDDVDGAYAAAKDAGLSILLELRDEDFGQRHFITQDPDGTLIDVIKPIPPSADFAAQYADSALPA